MYCRRFRKRLVGVCRKPLGRVYLSWGSHGRHVWPAKTSKQAGPSGNRVRWTTVAPQGGAQAESARLSHNHRPQGGPRPNLRDSRTIDGPGDPRPLGPQPLVPGVGVVSCFCVWPPLNAYTPPIWTCAWPSNPICYQISFRNHPRWPGRHYRDTLTWCIG